MSLYKVIGLMSGTSLDGLDIVFCSIWQEATNWQYKIENTKTISYSEKMVTSLSNAIHLSAIELLKLNNKYGIWLGEQVSDFISEHKLQVDFIASHGHTIHHQPKEGFTYQIGSGQHIANASKQKVVCDFRTNDVALDGQGAPLVPIGDRFLFGEYDFCLNLGGISNISFEKENERVAYDVGLANMILNYITQKQDLTFDKGGAIAKAGNLNEALFADLNNLEYYKLPYPKSTGYEWFSQKVIPIVEKHQDTLENLLHTAIHHNCVQIAKAIQQEKIMTKAKVLVTGGGALNTFFIEVLCSKLPKIIEAVIPSKELIEFKEALIFAFMSVLKIENKINVLRSVTGAQRDSCSGVVFLPQ